MNSIIAAVRNSDELFRAVESGVGMIFHLSPDIMSLPADVKKVHSAGKKIFIHIDLAEGIGKDKLGLEYSKKCGVDGIISTRNNMIRFARDTGLFTVQRFFIVDSHSIDTTVESLKMSKPDMIEIMPGVAPKIIRQIKEKTDIPVIAGGLIDNEAEVREAINNGANAISTGKVELW